MPGIAMKLINWLGSNMPAAPGAEAVGAICACAGSAAQAAARKGAVSLIAFICIAPRL
jgi:hypothetical protein